MRRTCDTTRTHPHGCTRGAKATPHDVRRAPRTETRRPKGCSSLEISATLATAEDFSVPWDHFRPHGTPPWHMTMYMGKSGTTSTSTMCTEYKDDVGKTKRNATHTTTSRGRKMTHANTQTHKHDLPQHNNSREQRNGPLQIRRKSANMPQAQRTKKEFYSPPARSTNISYIYTFTTKMHDGVRKVEPADPLQEQ